MNISNCTALIMGGGNGIGRATALALAAKGTNVVVVDVDIDAAKAVAKDVEALNVRASVFQVDVADETAIEHLADAVWEAYGSVEILFNNVGVLQPSKPLLKTTAEDFDWLFSVNVGGMMNAIRIIGSRMAAADQPGWIVNTGSEHSFGVPHKYSGLYTATKHAVLGLSDVLAQELPDHIGVSVLCPGLVNTTLWRSKQRRQNQFGGAEEVPDTDGALMALGIPAEEVATRVVKAIESEEFYILTHSHVVEFAERRWDAIEKAFSTQTPRTEGDERYLVGNLVRELKSKK